MLSRDKYFAALAEKGQRDDGRKADQIREISIQTGVVEKAEGSAVVNLGSTKVMVGIKMSVKEPFEDTPGEGILIAGAEFSPIASPLFESGPPDENSIELARIVDRGIRESHAIDVEKLCVTKGEEVWSVNLDIYILNNAGNMIDAAALASLAALLTTKIPKYEDKKVIYGEHKEKLPLTCKPIAVTHLGIGNNLFVDPNFEEERVQDSRLTVTTIDNGNISSIQKGGPKGLTLKQIEDIFESSVKLGKDIRKKL